MVVTGFFAQCSAPVTSVTNMHLTQVTCPEITLSYCKTTWQDFSHILSYLTDETSWVEQKACSRTLSNSRVCHTKITLDKTHFLLMLSITRLMKSVRFKIYYNVLLKSCLHISVMQNENWYCTHLKELLLFQGTSEGATGLMDRNNNHVNF